MAYDASPSSTHNPATGTIVPASWLDIINTDLEEIGAGWTSYTPTWTSSGTAPALGNGTLSGGYKKLGKLLFVRIYFVAGSTSTFGTGNYRFALPSGVTSHGTTIQSLSAFAQDVTGNYYVLGAYVTGGAAFVSAVVDGAGNIGQTAPFTWAQGDLFVCTGAIECA